MKILGHFHELFHVEHSARSNTETLSPKSAQNDEVQKVEVKECSTWNILNFEICPTRDCSTWNNLSLAFEVGLEGVKRPIVAAKEARG